MLTVKLPDGSSKQVPPGSRPRDVAEGIGKRLAAAAIAARVNGEIVDLAREFPATGDIELRLLTDKDAESLEVLRHSCAHIMARAVMRLFPGTQLAFGPALENGFYYDIDAPTPITEADFPRIEAEMKKIVEKAEPFERFEQATAEGRQLVLDMAQGYKVEHIDDDLKKYPSLSFYRQGEFIDLCRGPHIPHAGKVGAFKVLSIAGAYWKNDSSRKQLQRLYATAFFTQKELDAYLHQLEQAKLRDHRLLGKQLKLFTVSQLVGPGLILWMPRGATIRALLENFIKDELVKRGYEPVYTPHIGRLELYRTSGHFPYYRDSQFPPMYFRPAAAFLDLAQYRFSGGQLDEAKQKFFREFFHEAHFVPKAYAAAPSNEEQLQVVHAAVLKELEWANIDLPEYHEAKTWDERSKALERWLVGQEGFLLKPMNCPHHIHIYKAIPRSYRDLPVRLAEFGTVYRFEQTGELNGMTRVRGFTQDDAHLFCTPEQVEDELRSNLDLVLFVLDSLGLTDYRVRLSLREPGSDKYVGSLELWEKAEKTLIDVVQKLGMKHEMAPGEAAFYGPKVDFIVRDCIGRDWQLGTVQLDYNLPDRFDLEYTGADNKPHRPVMIHRAPFGSMERFCGILIEHFAGAFPLWLAPEQARVLTVSDKSAEYGRKVEAELKAAGFRVSGDYRAEKIGAKVRDGSMEKVPYLLVVGEKDMAAGTVSVRDESEPDMKQRDKGSKPVAEVIAALRKEVDEKRIRQVSTATAGLSDGSAKYSG